MNEYIYIYQYISLYSAFSILSQSAYSDVERHLQLTIGCIL